ncbi:MAG TPA: Gfo/Idh/MocA family oxidoreductase [Chthonomonadaceae bacterium]|nr:Gfo/Idh/MocA family oxidoreductase [Chthonomonadaceae bacterium]
MNQPRKRISRRSFLKASAATTAVVGMPAIVPEGVIGRPGRPGANDRIVIGHIGVGGMGSGHVHEDAAALCDVDANHLADVAKKVTQGTPFLCKDYRELLDHMDIDAVMIATPDHWHAIMMVNACQAGKDVYSEKPTCKTIQEGQAMVNAARRYGRVVQIGAQGRSQDYAHAACQFIRNGQIGTVRRVEVWHENNWTDGWGEEKPPPPELDWDLWLGPARWKPYNPQYAHFNFRWMMDFGAGFIRDRGNHVLSLVMWCMNADNTGPVSVEATGEPAKEGVWDVPVTMEVKWEFKNPDWTLTWSQPGLRHTFPGGSDPIPWGAKYYGDRDTLIVSGGDGGGDTEKKAWDYQPPADGVHIFKSPGHRENWLQCIKTRERTVMPADVGYHVIILPIIANIAYQLGRKLQWDPLAERFIGDEEANRFLAEPYRVPWHL